MREKRKKSLILQWHIHSFYFYNGIIKYGEIEIIPITVSDFNGLKMPQTELLELRTEKTQETNQQTTRTPSMCKVNFVIIKIAVRKIFAAKKQWAMMMSSSPNKARS